MDNNEYKAPIGKVWICIACRKVSKHRIYGPLGWDEACFINSILIGEDELNESIPPRQD